METNNNSFDEFPLVGSARPEAIDEFADFPLASGGGNASQATASQKTESFRKGFVGGTIESVSTLAGAALGGRAGFPGFVVGATGGMVAGSYLRGKAAEQGWTYSDIEEITPGARPSAVGGETFGAATGFTTGFTGLAKMGYETAGKTFVGKYINKMFDFAKTKTKTFLGIETSMGVSAAAGGAVAESYRPGDPVTRMGAEVTAGMLNPARLVYSATSSLYNRGQNIVQRLTPAGRETAAGKKLVTLLESRGEDPVAIGRMMEAAGDIETNVAYLTGSKTLGALQLQLAKYSGKFGQEAQAQAEEGIKSLVGMIDTLKRTGDPEALVEAAQMKRELFNTILAGNVQKSESAALSKVSKITKDTPSAKMELSKIARESISESLKQARAAERELWSNVPKENESFIRNTLNRYSQLAQDILPEERASKLPSVATNFLKRVKDDQGGVTTTGEMIQFRSSMLDAAREAQEKGEYSIARIYGNLAESALDDLDAAYTGVDVYDTARAFSRSLNDTFTRTFVGKATAEGRFGDRIPPELMMSKALSTGKEAGALQMQELEEATRFLNKMAITDDSRLADTMMDAQERMIRLAAAESIDQKSGFVNPVKLSKFMRDNEVLIDRFPGVKNALQEAVDSEEARLGIQAVSKRSSKIFETESAFSQVLKKDPVALSLKAMTSMNPEKELQPLIKVAKSAGEQGRLGLRTAVLDAAMKKSTTMNGNIKFDELEKLLFESATTGKKSVIDVMKANGVFKSEDITMLRKVFDTAKKIQTATKPGTAIDEMDDNLDVLVDLITRATGATLATKGAGITGQKAAGHGLIIAAGGSRAAKAMLEKIPSAKIKEVLIDAMTNPKLMQKLLEKTPDEPAKIEKMRFLHAYLIQSGIYNIQEMLESEQEPQLSESAMSAL